MMTRGPGRYLLGDLGGTHARFVLYDSVAAVPVASQVLATAAHAGPEAALREFLARTGALLPDWVALAVAAPIQGDEVALTNEHWQFSISALRRALAVERLEVVNDFAAVALALPALKHGDRLAIGGRTIGATGPMVVLGPGTGLGVATVVPVGAVWHVLPGEGGHVTLAASGEAQARVIAQLRRSFPHVSAERVLSGPGLANLYRAVCASSGIDAEALTPEEIARRGRTRECAECAAALDLFFEFLGSVAGNLALTLGAIGGVYLAGGILPKLVEPLTGSGFRGHFEAKGRFADYLSAIPTWLVTRENPAFLGLLRLLEA